MLGFYAGLKPRAFFDNARQALWATSQPKKLIVVLDLGTARTPGTHLPGEVFFPFLHAASGQS